MAKIFLINLQIKKQREEKRKEQFYDVWKASGLTIGCEHI